MTRAHDFNRRSSLSLMRLFFLFFLSEENVKGLLIQAGKLQTEDSVWQSDDNLSFLIRFQRHKGSDCTHPPRPDAPKVPPKEKKKAQYYTFPHFWRTRL